jgi:hypothetical protein
MESELTTRLVETQPGEAEAIYTFETVAGEQFSLVRPAMSQEAEAEVREILEEE